MNTRLRFFTALTGVLLSGCATIPSGPSVLVLPGTGKSFDRFQADSALCRQFAGAQLGGMTPDQALTESTVKSGAVGAVLGAALGAAAGGGQSAGVGAASGLLVGSAVGAGAGTGSAYDVQRRYDYAYMQCMYARGNQIPVAGAPRTATVRRYPPPPPPPDAAGPYYSRPPPPGTGPPPDL
jgi:hypothetical protein